MCQGGEKCGTRDWKERCSGTNNVRPQRPPTMAKRHRTAQTAQRAQLAGLEADVDAAVVGLAERRWPAWGRIFFGGYYSFPLRSRCSASPFQDGPGDVMGL